jgi:hypothetical protein
LTLTSRSVAAATLVVLSLLWWCLSALTVQDKIAGFNWDDAFYLLMADVYRGNLTAYPNVYRIVFLWRDYPPVYPLFLALFQAGSESIGNAYIANSLAVTLSVGAVYWYAITLLKARSLALIAAACFLIAPTTLRFAFGLWSENLFIALAFAGLALAHAKDSKYAAVGAGLLLALAAITRTAGIAWCAAFVIWALIYKPNKHLLAIAGATLVPLCERLLHAGPAYQSHLEQVGSLEYLTTQTSHNALALIAAFGHAWSVNEPVSIVVGLATASLAMFPLFSIRLSLEATVLLVYLAQILAWGFPEHAARFVYPIQPLILVAALFSLSRISELPYRPGVLAAAHLPLMSMLAVMAATNLSPISARLQAEEQEVGALRKVDIFVFGKDPILSANATRFRLQLANDASRIKRLVPENECVFSEFPPVLLLFAKRATDLPPWREWDEIASLRGTACRFYYAIPAYLNRHDDTQLERLGARRVFWSAGDPAHGPALPTGILFELSAGNGQG